ncbi:isoprenoid synthase domain-containing protein [Mycena leptocephala]|nr:isoprenoid synthase domain-containing protein [Mycena leptocephala]
MSPRTPSVQLPDLLGLSRAFDLRTNRHCHAVSSASEKWFMAQQNILNDEEKAALRSMKIGLWASVCFPTCDPPQLRVATDFLTALVACTSRLAQAQSLRDCGWYEEQSSDNLERLNRSSEAFRDAQTQILSHHRSNTIPGLDAYIELRRLVSGMPMVLDLIEMAEGLKIASDDQRWDRLKCYAADIIALSTDVCAYNNDQFVDNKFNIVSIVREDKGLSVQGALNYSYSLIEQAFQNFLAAESTLGSLTPDSKLYLRGLKDCIVGTLNWCYETELYLGRMAMKSGNLAGYF